MEKNGIYLLINAITGGGKKVSKEEIQHNLEVNQNLRIIAESGKGKTKCKHL